MATNTTPLPDLASPPTALPPDIVAAGQPVPAITRLQIMSPTEWENFILEWAHSLKDRYSLVERCAGAGDMGRDVVAYVSPERLLWDNYQCKHYDHPLMPSDVWVELGKLCYYTYIGEYTVPRSYSFVAPRGAGNRLSKLLRQPEELQSGILLNWDSHCRSAITSTKEILLSEALRAYIEAFDFSIVSAPSPLTIIDEHRQTPWHVARFGGGLPARPPAPAPPATVALHEAAYVRALLDAYEERAGKTVSSIEDIDLEDLKSHFLRSRREFYSAEALREFSRDNVPSGTFDRLLDEMHDGVVDVIEASHRDAVERVLRTVQQAKVLQLTANALVSRITTTDRGGMCHQLANDLRVKWRQ